MTRQIAHIQRGLAAAVAGVAVAAALAFAAPAGAATPAGVTFDTAGEHALVLPGYVTSVTITAAGGRGGITDDGYGGPGAQVTATVPVAPGSTLYAVVGGDGTDARQGDSSGGFNGGGNGGFAPQAWHVGAGGGGASDVRTCSSSS